MKDFPWFEGRNIWTGKKPKHPFPFPCECGDGWFQLIYNLCKEVDKFYKDNELNINNFFILQIKEKWGSLCFYTNGVPEEVHDIITKYENLSSETCDVCGEKGEIVNNGGWFRALCDVHNQKINDRIF